MRPIAIPLLTLALLIPASEVDAQTRRPGLKSPAGFQQVRYTSNVSNPVLLNPIQQGWTEYRGGNGRGRPVAGAWQTDDPLTPAPGSLIYYERMLGAADLVALRTYGWTLQVSLKALKTSCTGGAALVSFHDGSRTWTMCFSQSSDGSVRYVRLQDGLAGTCGNCPGPTGSILRYSGPTSGRIEVELHRGGVDASAASLATDPASLAFLDDAGLPIPFSGRSASDHRGHANKLRHKGPSVIFGSIDQCSYATADWFEVNLEIGKTLGPSPYLTLADSPFQTDQGALFLEDFEAGVFTNLKRDVPIAYTFPNGRGHIVSTPQANQPPQTGWSVDQDDGVRGRVAAYTKASEFGNFIDFTFGSAPPFPNRVGFVWTGAAGASAPYRIRILAFDINQKRIAGGVVSVVTAPRTVYGVQNVEDRFVGVHHEAGIARVRVEFHDDQSRIQSANVDHFQVGYGKGRRTNPRPRLAALDASIARGLAFEHQNFRSSNPAFAVTLLSLTGTNGKIVLGPGIEVDLVLDPLTTGYLASGAGTSTLSSGLGWTPRIGLPAAVRGLQLHGAVAVLDASAFTGASETISFRIQ